jgi:hypothetical protein
MPTGYEFSQELKQLIFNVIKFVENEKNGPVIPLNNVNDRLESMLGISLSSIRRLKQEMREERDRIMEESERLIKKSKTRSMNKWRPLGDFGIRDHQRLYQRVLPLTTLGMLQYLLLVHHESLLILVVRVLVFPKKSKKISGE